MENLAYKNGWLIIDKQLNQSSTLAGAIVKRKLGQKKIGHAGTLDPLATGVLPLALGEATKTIPYCVAKDKEYEFEITFGESRTTDDAEGEVSATTTTLPRCAEIEGVLHEFLGEIAQVPPRFSAIKINGKRSYALARAGEMVEISPRNVMIYNLRLLEQTDHKAKFWCHCGMGTYIRSLGRDIAERLGSLGYISALRRTRVGKFHASEAIVVEKDSDLDYIKSCVLPVGFVLDDIPAISVSGEDALLLKSGMVVNLYSKDLSDGMLQIKSSDKLICLAEYIDGKVKPKRVFHL